MLPRTREEAAMNLQVNQHVKLNRRAFVIGTATAGAGLALGLDLGAADAVGFQRGVFQHRLEIGAVQADMAAEGLQRQPRIAQATARRLASFGCTPQQIEAARPEALQWALQRGSRSGRVAWQFAKDYAGKLA